MHSSLSNLKACCQLYRFQGWVHFLGLVLLGFYMTGSSVNFGLLLVLFASACYLAHAYAINNYFDRWLDSSDKQSKNPLAGREIAPFCFLLVALLPIVPSLVAAFWHGKTSFLLIVTSFLVSTLYSVPPFRLKATLVGGFLLNAALFMPLFLLGWIAGEGDFLQGLKPALVFSLPVLIMQAFHELEDASDDRKANCKTLVLWGKAIDILIHMMFFLQLVSIIWLIKFDFLPQETWIPGAIYSIGGIASTIAFRKTGFAPYRMRIAMRWFTIVFGISILSLLILS